MNVEFHDLTAKVISNYQNLRSNDNNLVAIATNWLEAFYQTVYSISILTNILKTNDNPIYRLHAAIGLKQSLNLNWEKSVLQELDVFLQFITNIILSEPIANIRNTLVSILWKYINNNYLNYLFSILQTKIDNLEIIETVMCLSKLFCKNPKFCQAIEVKSFLSVCVMKCHESGSIDACIEALKFLSEATKFRIFPSLDFIWEQYLQMFDVCINNTELLNQVCSLFNQIIENDPFIINCESISHKIISLINQQNVPIESLLMLFGIFETLFDNIPMFFVQSGLFQYIIQIGFQLLSAVFSPFELTRVTFFESSISTFSRRGGIPVLEFIWQMCSNLQSTEEGRFISFMSIKSTTDYCENFYDDKIKQICDLYSSCLSSQNHHILLFSAISFPEFKSVFQRVNNHPSILFLIKQMLEILIQNPLNDVYYSFSQLLDSLSDTTEIFDEVVTIVFQIFPSISSHLYSDLIECLISLIRHSKDKSSQYLETFAPLNQYFSSVNVEERSEIIPSLLRMVNQLFKHNTFKLVSEVPIKFQELNQIIHTIDYSILIPALNIIITILKYFPSENIPIALLDLEYIMNMASVDWSDSWRDLIRQEHIYNGVDIVPFNIRFKSSEKSLLIITLCAIISKEIFTNNISKLINIVKQHLQSTNGKKCACKSLLNIIKAIYKYMPDYEGYLIKVLDFLFPDLIYFDVETDLIPLINIFDILFVGIKVKTPLIIDTLRTITRMIIISENDQAIKLYMNVFDMFLQLNITSPFDFLMSEIAEIEYLSPIITFSIFQIYNVLNLQQKQLIEKLIIENGLVKDQTQTFSILLLTNNANDQNDLSLKIFEVLYGVMNQNNDQIIELKEIAKNIFEYLLMIKGECTDIQQLFVNWLGTNQQILRLVIDICLLKDKQTNCHIQKVLLNNISIENTTKLLAILFKNNVEIVNGFLQLLENY